MSSRTVLVIDDESYLTHALSLSLRRAGYEPIVASDGEQGYQLACDCRPALIVTDYQMPVLSGLEMCRKLFLNPHTSAIPALMLTARGYRIEPADLVETNIKLLMSKPFSARDLIARIQGLLGHSGTDRREEAAA